MRNNRKVSRLVAWLNRLKLKQKLRIMQICCVILPLLLTDSVVAAVIMHAEQQESLQEMRNIADSVEYTIMSYSAQLVNLMQDIYKNREVNEFISSTYVSPLDYYNRHLNFAKVSLFTLLMSNNDCSVVIYTDAEGVVNGGNFQRLEKAEREKWYQTFKGQDKEILLYADFAKVNWENRRTISFIRRMDYMGGGDQEAVLRLDWDYSDILRAIINAKYGSTVYVCEGDRILFSKHHFQSFIEFPIVGKSPFHAVSWHSKMCFVPLRTGSFWGFKQPINTKVPANLYLCRNPGVFCAYDG